MNNYLKKIIERNIQRVDIIRDGSLSSDSPKYQVSPIPNLKIELKEHQKTLVRACLDLENGLTIQQKYNGVCYQSNIGIIGDNVGAGKSLSALSLVAIKPKIDNYSFPNQYLNTSGMGIILFNNQLNQKIFGANLFIVPHSVILQWEKYIKQHTLLSYQKINSSKSLIFSLEMLDSKDIILVSNNFVPQFYEQCLLLLDGKSFLFQRVFIDEADNIRISHGIEPKDYLIGL